MNADRSTENGWLRRLEKAADEHEAAGTNRAFAFRGVLRKAWEGVRERGYDDGQDDIHRAQRTAERDQHAAEQAAKE